MYLKNVLSADNSIVDHYAVVSSGVRLRTHVESYVHECPLSARNALVELGYRVHAWLLNFT